MNSTHIHCCIKQSHKSKKITIEKKPSGQLHHLSTLINESLNVLSAIHMRLALVAIKCLF